MHYKCIRWLLAIDLTNAWVGNVHLYDPDEVFFSTPRACRHTSTTLKPDVYVKGQDYRDLEQDISGKIQEEKKAVESVGGQLCFTDELPR